ncbi:MAG TPA: AMP-binding protein [Candidatus Polarisedimenticolia bacterium]|nr:AMP-binding protein [Candidatus Polarisedimenticolia bacterium]
MNLLETEPSPPSVHDLTERLRRLESFGGRNAFFWREGVRWRRRSYAELRRRIETCAATLAAAGAGEGTPVLIQGPAGPDWIEALLAIFFLGAVAVPLDEVSGEGFVAEVAARSGARIAVTPRHLPSLAGCRRVELGAWEDGAAPAPVSWDAARTAEIVFTSGTTGEPKGVVLTHGNLAADFFPIERAFLKRENLVQAFGELRFLSTLPLSHMFGQAMSAFLPLFMGLTVAFVPPRPRDVMEAARRLRAWGLFTVPRLMDLLGAEARLLLRESGGLEEFQRRQERFESWPFYLQPLFFGPVRRMLGWRFRLFVSGGAPLPPEVQRFWERSGYLVVQGYGLTETAPIVSISNPFDRRAGSVGRPLGIQEVKLGEGGEILVRGPNVTRGYFGTGGDGGEGWFHTGDVGEIDERGRLTIRGRVKDVIVTAEGENVHPGDVESALAKVEGVREASVLGLPGPGGDRVHAVLLLEAVTPGPEEIVRRANAALEPRQRIKDYTIWTDGDLPRTATGKVRKMLLRERLLAARESSPDAAAPRRMEEAVRRLVARVARIEPARVSSASRLTEDLGFASLDLVELGVAFEEEYGVPLPEESLARARVRDLERVAAEALTGGVQRPASGPLRAAEAAVVTGPEAPKTTAGRNPAVDLLRGSAGTEAEERLVPAAMRRGELPLGRWARLSPIRWLRRGVEECLMRPFVLLYTRPTIEGLHNLDATPGPYLFVADHHSFMDTGVLKVALPRPLRGRIAPAMTTRYHRVHFREMPGRVSVRIKEAFQVGLVEFFFNAWPLPETVRFRSSLSYAGELADAGWSLLIFPEGRHVPEGSEAKFRGGIGIFARELRMPVVPVHLEGTSHVLPERVYWPRFGKTRIVIGRPVVIDARADPAETTRRLETAVRELKKPAT